MAHCMFVFFGGMIFLLLEVVLVAVWFVILISLIPDCLALRKLCRGHHSVV